MTKKSNASYKWASALGLLLAGCAQTPPPDTTQPQVYVAFNPQRWLAEGKIALRYPECSKVHGCKEKSVMATAAWTHQNKTEMLVLSDPMGQERMRITYANGVVNVREGSRERSFNREDMIREMGIPLPFESLAAWLTTKRADETFNAEGWHVELSDWQGTHYRSIRLRQKDYQTRLVVQNIYAI